MIPDLPAAAALERSRRVAQIWLPAFLAGDRAPADIYAARVVTWHAVTGTETVVAEPPSFDRLRAAVPDLHREDVRVELLADGLLVQATTVGTVGAHQVRVAACLVVRLDDEGRIHRFEEYADRESAAPFAALLRD